MVNAGYYGDYYTWYFLSGMGSALVYLSLAITVATIVAPGAYTTRPASTAGPR